MKKLIFILIVFLVSISANAQKQELIQTAKNDSTFSIASIKDLTLINIESIRPSNVMTFCNDSLRFNINFSGDSLIVSGNMPMSKSAELFIKWCHTYMKFKMDSVVSENNQLRLENKRLLKLYGL